VHVEGNGDPLLLCPPDDLGDAIKVDVRVVTGSGFELAPVEDQPNHVEPEGAHLGEVVARVRRRGLVVGGLGRLDLTQGRLGDAGRVGGTLPFIGRSIDGEQSRSAGGARIGDVLQADDGHPAQDHPPPAARRPPPAARRRRLDREWRRRPGRLGHGHVDEAHERGPL
jgi:hypothetical protein